MELRDRNIFILGLMRYDNAIESTNYTIAKQLAAHNHVYYFDNPYTWKDCLKMRGTPAFRRRKKHFPATSDGIINTEIPNLKVVITPPVASINWMPEGRMYRAALRLAEQTIVRRMMQVKKAAGIKDLIYINSFNFYYPGISRLLSPKLSVYHCVDPLVHPYELKHGRCSQTQIAQESDAVVCTSSSLWRTMRNLNPQTYLVPNAADVLHSGKALDAALPVHPVLTDIPRPVIGYFGAVERRLDYDLLLQVAALNPDKSFVFTGPVSSEFLPQAFALAKNIFLTGPVSYAEMPQVLKGFDVAMIPFKKDKVSAAIFPLKLFEYLGAGLPVVATDFNPELAQYTRRTVSYCDRPTSFSAAINEALFMDTPALKAERLAVAADNTWAHRGEEFAAIIYARLKMAANTRPLLSH